MTHEEKIHLSVKDDHEASAKYYEQKNVRHPIDYSYQNTSDEEEHSDFDLDEKDLYPKSKK